MQDLNFHPSREIALKKLWYTCPIGFVVLANAPGSSFIGTKLDRMIHLLYMLSSLPFTVCLNQENPSNRFMEPVESNISSKEVFVNNLGGIINIHANTEDIEM